jgi:arylformamidase
MEIIKSAPKAKSKNTGDHLYGEFETQAELDAGYDVEHAVPDFNKYIAGFQKRSLQARASADGRQTFSYGSTSMERLTIYPSQYFNSPVLVFIHGGYWRIGTGDDYDFIIMGPLQAGYTVVNVTYGLAPKVTISEIVRQVRAAIAWTTKNIARHNGDKNQIVIAGHSAGAHLATMALDTKWSDYDLAGSPVKGVLAISGLYDLLPVSQTFVQPSLRISGDEILSYSPIRLIKPHNVPLTVSWGSIETSAFKQQSLDYLDAWVSGGNQGNSLIIDQANHFNILNEFEATTGQLTKAVVSLTNSWQFLSK